MANLLTAFSPNPDAFEVHSIEIAAAPETVYQTLWTVDLAKVPVAKVLLALRSLPTLLSQGSKAFSSREITLRSLLDMGFGLLAEEPGSEMVIGILGRFWLPTKNIEPFDREAFLRPVAPGIAQAAWNFHVVAEDDGRTTLWTETRITCGDPASRFKFRLYWFFVRPFSGLIRILMLREIRRAIETRDK